jgi:hypothetical protein
MSQSRSLARCSYTPVIKGKIHPGRLSFEAIRDEKGKVIAIYREGKLTFINQLAKSSSSGRVTNS